MRKLSCLLAIIASVGVLAISIRGPLAASDKPPVTLDEFFNSVEYNAARISPDGAAVVIQTTRSDWEANRYRTDLWLYRVAGSEREFRWHANSAYPIWPRTLAAMVS